MEETILEFENHLFGIKGNKEGMFKIPKEHYTLTNERLKVNKQGVMTQTKSDIELYKIKDVTVQQKLKDKAMNVGNIEIVSSDESDPVLVLKNVKDPHNIREQIRDASKKAKQEAGIAYRQNV